MEFRILGPLQVLDGKVEVPLRSPKERALLAVLLLHGGAVVSRDRLIEELWGESPPPTAGKALNVHVSQLRKTLARNGNDPIATRPPGYALRLDRERLDAARFEQLVADARGRTAAGLIESACALLGEALGLWRGPALAGIDLESAARNQIGRLEELRLAAQMDRIDCDLALGRHQDVIGELEVLIAEHPLRERLRAQYMLALYRGGRQADALRAYQEARKALVDELGLEPSEALQRLERGILNHDPALEAPSGIPKPAPHPDAPRRRRVRRSVAAVSVMAVAAALAAIAVVVAAGGGGITAPPNSVAVIDPAHNKVVDTIGVGIEPGPVAVGAGAVWVGNREDRSLTRLDPRTRAVVKNLNLAGTPTALAANGRAVWVAYGRLGSVARVDPQFESVGTPIRVTGRGAGYATADGAVAAGPAGIWATFGDSTVARIGADGTRVLRRGYAGSQPSAIALGAPAVWVANGGDDTVSAINPETAAQVQTINVARRPRGIAIGGNAIWVSAFDDNVVSRVAGSSSRTIDVGDGPVGVAFGEGSVWVANSRDGTVSRIDPEQGKVVATIRVGHRPEAVAIGGGAVWVTVAP